jgi:hypothetical protein
MGRIRIIGVCIAAVLVSSAVSAPIASAVKGPSWETAEWTGTCAKGLVWGWYATQAECEVGGFPFPTAGGWNRVMGAAKLLEAGKSRESALSNTVLEGTRSQRLSDAIASVECSAAKGTGKLEGGEPGKDTATVTLTGCKVFKKESKEEAVGCTVRSKGAASGAIELKSKSALVYIGTKAQAEKQEGPVGDLYAPSSGSVLVQLEFSGGTCPTGSEGSTNVEGETVAEVTAGMQNVSEHTFPKTAIERYFHWEGEKIAEVKVNRLKVFSSSSAVASGALGVSIDSIKEGIEASPK